MAAQSYSGEAVDWAISDIHGCAASFKTLVEDVIGLEHIQTLYLLGDYIDRGPDSKKVFDLIFEWRKLGKTIHCLMGNHEDLMIRSLHSPIDFDLWMANGGGDTLNSFDVHKSRAIPRDYLDFVRELQLWEETDSYWLVHAGFDTSHSDIFANKRALLWKRNTEYKPELMKGKKVIHGHTPTPYTKIEEDLKSNKPVLSIDAGCVYPHKPGLGYLCALNLQYLDLVIQQNIDIIPEN